MKKILTSIFYFFDERSDLCRLLMQSYGVFHSIPRKVQDSSLTCMDKRPAFGQIGEKASKNVQCSDIIPAFLCVSEKNALSM